MLFGRFELRGGRYITPVFHVLSVAVCKKAIQSDSSAKGRQRDTSGRASNRVNKERVAALALTKQ